MFFANKVKLNGKVNKPPESTAQSKDKQSFRDKYASIMDANGRINNDIFKSQLRNEVNESNLTKE